MIINSGAEFLSDNIQLVRNAARAPPPLPFPQTRGDVNRMNGRQLNTWLIYYGLPVNGTLEVRRRRFLKIIGGRSLTTG